MVMKLKEMVAETQSILLELDSEASELFCVAEKKLSVLVQIEVKKIRGSDLLDFVAERSGVRFGLDLKSQSFGQPRNDHV